MNSFELCILPNNDDVFFLHLWNLMKSTLDGVVIWLMYLWKITIHGQYSFEYYVNANESTQLE